MKKIITFVLYSILSIGFSLQAANLYLIANNGTTWSGQTSGNTGFTNVYTVDLANSGADGMTAVTLTQWLSDRSAPSPIVTPNPSYKVGGSGGSTGVYFASGDQVWIAAGTYNTTSAWAIQAAFANVYGGFSGSETAVSGRSVTNNWLFTNETIINGTGSAATFFNAGGNRLFTMDGLSFTLFAGINAVQLKGGMTIQNCRFYNNSYTPVYMYINASCTGLTTTIKNCQFKDNTGSSSFPYGIYTQTGTSSAGPLTVDVNNCIFDGNKNTSTTSANNAGAIWFNTNLGAGLNHKVNNCTFTNNDCISTNAAGASAISAPALTTGSIAITNCLFYSNGSVTTNSKPALYLSSTATAGTYNCTVWNCTLVNNVSGGAKIANSTGVNVFNTAFWGTDGGSTSGSGYVNCTGTNPLLTNCAYNAITSGTSTACITLPYTNATGTNAPNFVDPNTNDWQLATGSSLIDNGTSISAPTAAATDLAGLSRPQGASYDIGAYEKLADVATGFNKLSSAAQCFSGNHSIEFRGLTPGDEVAIFTFAGDKIKSEKLNAANTSIAIARGMYIVKVSNQVYKIIVN